MARISSIPNFFVHILNNIVDLREENFDFDLICSEEDYGDYIRKQYGFNVIYTDIQRDISPLKDLFSIFSMARLFKKGQYQIVHSATPKAGLITCLAGLLAGTPIRIHTFTGQRWANLKGSKRELLKAIDRLIIMLNTQCYADSPGQIEYLINEGVAKPGRILCLGEGSFGGVDLTKFDPSLFTHSKTEIAQEYNIPLESLWMIYVGRITSDKGINELIKAFEELKTDKKVELILIGHFEDALDPIHERSRVSIENNKHIHYLGFQNAPARFISACDFLCLPSYREGFGTVVIEAAALGVPTIGTDIPGLRDSIVNNETGLLVAPSDVTDLLNAISLIIENPDLRAKFSKHALSRTREKFCSKRLSQLLKMEYLGLIQG